ncbi:ribonuclease P protein subunit p40-like [Mytilus trossulus]|uniref:ribonuclease P protein subunit p40-like n=1 Tax=Mytilus trossulus TaxID=6551 RepID=UPI003007CDE2
MAAPIDKSLPVGKLVFEKSSFKNEKSKHEEFIEDHHFNYAISCILPNCKRIPDILQSSCVGEKSFLVQDLPLIEVISLDLIEAFIKRGKLRMLSHGGNIDTDDFVAVLPTGHLILHLSKDTYQQLGLEGKPSQFPKRKKSKYIVDIDLTSPSFKPGKKCYNRVKWCFKDRLGLKFNFLATWTPSDNEVCPSSLQKYLTMKGCKCKPVKIKCNMKKYNDVLVPDIDPSHVDFDNMDYSYPDVFEWLGGFSCGIDLSCNPDDYLSNYSFNGPTQSPATCSYVQYSGYFSCQTVQSIVKSIRDNMEEWKLPWCSVTVQGFMDSPLSWKQREHGYLNNGDNLYTFIIFPDDSYWLYSAYGSYDLVS